MADPSGSLRGLTRAIRVPFRHVEACGIAKTVAACFKLRSKIGQDVAIEALREVVQARRATRAQIMESAEIDRVARIMRPCMETVQ